MLILLTAGEPQPLPVPTSTTLPHNILHVDVLALEHSLLCRGAKAGVVPYREHPLPNLAALLQIIGIPVPPHIPLGNAGNDAFYTLLAFQKLLMVDTRLPDFLQAPLAAFPRNSMMPGMLTRSQSPNSPRQRRISRPMAVTTRPKPQTVYWDDSKYKGAAGTPVSVDQNTPIPTTSSVNTPTSSTNSGQSGGTPQRPKLKQDRSVKDLAGALAKAWVG